MGGTLAIGQGCSETRFCVSPRAFARRISQVPEGGFREGSEGQAGRQAGRQGYNVFINAEFYSWDYNTDFNEKQFDTRRVFRQSGDLDPQWKKHEPNLTTLRKDRRRRF